MRTLKSVIYTPSKLRVNEVAVELTEYTPAAVYRHLIGDYPKFFKMDGLCKIGFIAAELIFKNLPPKLKSECAIILFNRGGSVATDRKYGQTIRHPESYFPSPALFVYTLANIVTGEIAIRHKIFGETSFYILPEEDHSEMESIIKEAFSNPDTSLVLAGWVDYEDENNYKADLKLYSGN